MVMRSQRSYAIWYWTADGCSHSRLQCSADHTQIVVMCEKKPTKRQIDAVWDHAEAHGVVDTDYQRFMEQGGMCLIRILEKKR
jgi:hypothetical protein